MANATTFHRQLIERLRTLIRERQFAPGAKFLTEREVAERFKTSRPTANKALSSLVAEGLLEFRQGAGTFVRESVLDYDLQRLVSFTEKARSVGKAPGTEVLEFRRLPASDAPAEVRTALLCTPEEPLILMERVRLADEQPVIYERRHVLARHCPGMTKTDAKGSLYACWKEKFRLTISSAEEIIRAVNATKAQAARLQIAPGSACFLIVATGFLEGGAPLWHEETLYRADIYEFRNRIGGGAAPALGRIRG
jgi:GntR family transcriptional regulator